MPCTLHMKALKGCKREKGQKSSIFMDTLGKELVPQKMIASSEIMKIGLGCAIVLKCHKR